MDGIYVDQMLFGYNNGHTLINTSLDKTLWRQKDVDFLSDASGMGSFKSYITCYPIYEDGYYVFAKTWYAEELERPGCVWTHIVLVSFNDLTSMKEGIDIEAIFQRPDINEGFGQYGKKILCPAKKKQVINYSKYAIYTLLRSDRKIIIEDENTEKYEKPLLSILPILPIYILQKLTICTCSLANRYIDGIVFDYQITIPGKINILSREIENVVVYKNIEARFNYPLWVKYLDDKFTNNEYEKLYGYCSKYGITNRERFCSLTKVFYAVNEFKTPIVLQQYFVLLSKLSEGIKLIEKTRNLIYFYDDKEMKTWFEHSSLIKEILVGMKEKKGIFTKKDLSEKVAVKYAKCIYNECNKENLNLIFDEYVHNTLNRNGVKVVLQIIELLTPDDLDIIFNLNYSICMVLVRLDARFLLCKKIWKQDKNYQLDLLSNARLNNSKDKKIIIRNIVEHTTENISGEVYQMFGQDLENVLCDFYKSKDDFTLDQINFWIPYCAKNPKIYIDIVKHISDFTIIYELTEYVDSYNIQDIDECRQWINTLSKMMDCINEKQRYKISFFALPFVIKLKGSGVEKFDEMVFQEINYRLENSEMDFTDWKYVSTVLPEVSLEQSWDKCLRLRLAFKDIVDFNLKIK